MSEDKNVSTTEETRNRRKERIGYVVSDKMQKTIVVELEDRKSHPLYGKIIRTTSKVKAHDENGDAGIGDRVRLMETRPTSATKRWRLVEVLEKASRPSRGAPPREPRIRGVWLLHDDDLGPLPDWEAGRGFSSNPRSRKRWAVTCSVTIPVSEGRFATATARSSLERLIQGVAAIAMRRG